MTGDIRLSINDDGEFDLSLNNGDLTSDEGLETAVAISLFTDARVSDDELPTLTYDKKGWWGDMFPEVEGDKIGSKMWLTYRGKAITDNLRLSEDYATEALQWMIQDGVAKTVTAVSSFNIEGIKKAMITLVSITRPSNDQIKYQVLWDKQKLVRVIQNAI